MRFLFLVFWLVIPVQIHVLSFFAFSFYVVSLAHIVQTGPF